MSKTNKPRRAARRARRGMKVQKSVGAGLQTETLDNVMVTKFRYADTGYITEAAVGAGATWSFRTGDVYDPDYSGGGHQPLYLDQFLSSTGPYISFSVPKSKFTVHLSNVTANPIIVAITVMPIAVAPTSRTLAQERANNWSMLLAPVGAAGATATHTFTVDNPKLLGYPIPAFYTACSGNYGSSASSGIVYIQTWAVAGAGVVASVVANVVVDYTARLTQLGNVATS